jgi:hypothetical protein
MARTIGRKVLTFLLVTLVLIILGLGPKDPTVGAAATHPDEQVTVTCRTDKTVCVAIRVDTLGNVTTDRYGNLSSFMVWFERVSEEFVEQVTVYLSDDWDPAYTSP